MDGRCWGIGGRRIQDCKDSCYDMRWMGIGFGIYDQLAVVHLVLFIPGERRSIA